MLNPPEHSKTSIQNRRKTLDPLTEIEKTRKASYFIQNINTSRPSYRAKVPPIEMDKGLSQSLERVANARKEVDQLGNKIIQKIKKSFREKNEEIEHNLKNDDHKRCADELEKKRKSKPNYDPIEIVT